MPKVYNTDKDKVVGFKKDAEIITDHLLRGPKERDVVLITGMGGLGKTTLARRVYDDKRVVNYFDNRAWCTVSQEYQCNELLHKIYSQVCGSETKTENVAEKLRKSLMGKRYLIVLDDIWSSEAWEEVNRAFPSCDNGSRIVLTSRQENVVSDAKKVCLPFFTIDESWELLQLKLFKEERWPEEFEKIGLEICKKCGGLPLVVCLVAGLLQGVEKKEQMWHKFLNTLNSLAALKDEIQSNDVIELSYKHLPCHLKPCLLYFAAFPEDKEIEIAKLIRLWISEGFIDIIEKDRVEDAAEDCLNQLVGNNLIMVSNRKYDGRIISCIVHDLVRDFCLQKANEENFLQIIKLEDKLYPSDMNFTPPRLCYHKYGSHRIPSELVPWNSCIRAVLSFPNNNCYFDDHQYTYRGSWIAKKFEHITILDLEVICVDTSILIELNSLIHLRYLALELNGSGFVSPFSLENLECLITLKLNSDSKLHLPMIFWNMRSLRHMINWHYCGEYCTSKEEEAILGSEVLQTLNLNRELSIRDEHLLRKFPYLKYLECRVSPSYPFAEIDFLHHLESLNLVCEDNDKPDLLNDLKLTKFPSSIKELILGGITLSRSAISIISQLPNLEALILEEFCKIEGLEWIVEEETQFPKLKYLELLDVEIKIWNIISAESFPCLEQLIVEHCYGLVEVPSILVDSSTLKLISVSGGSSSTQKSVEKIREDAEDIGNEQLNVEILFRLYPTRRGRFWSTGD